MAVIIHALLLGAKAEWVKTRTARKVLPEPLSISLQYRQTMKEAEVSPKKEPTPTIPMPLKRISTPPAPEALDAPEIPPFTIPVKPPPQKKAMVKKARPEPLKKKEVATPPAASAEDVPENWMQMPESPPHPVQAEAPVMASVAPVLEKAADAPESAVEAAPAPPPAPLVEAVPMYRKNPAPQYPRVARRRGYEGRVILEVLVNEEGNVEDLRIFQSSGHRVLDRAAMKSVQGWLFEPGRRGDEKLEMWVKVPIRFDLK
jgi:protein TonB